MKKRLLSILLTVCMVLTLLPAVALAADGSNQSFTVTGGALGTDYTYASGVLTVCRSTAVTIKNTDPSTSTTDRIEVTSEANITLAGVNIDVSKTEWIAAFKITSSAGLVNITLADGSVNTLKSGGGSAGLQKDTTAEGTLLTIGGTGTLNAIGKSATNTKYVGSGIGGTYNASGSYITIIGGTVNATGGDMGAGIGGGYLGNGDHITISGGTVNATGGNMGAGIGGGRAGSGSYITISGGTVNAIATGYAAGIGRGNGGSDSNITISGGNVKSNYIPGTPTNGTKNVYMAVIPIVGDTTGDTDVSSMTFTSGGTAYTYNMNGAKSILDSGAGKVYVYLPGSSAEIAATASFGGNTYPGSVKNDNAAVLNPVFPVTKTAATNGSFTTKINTNEITQAAAGNTVTITPAANSGYEVDTVSVVKTGDTSTTVTVSSNTFTMPAYAVTVSVTFKAAISPLDLTGVGYDVAAGTLTGTTTNMQYSLDGAAWQDCTADNTTGLTFVAGTVKVRQKDKPTNERTVGTIAAPALAPTYAIDFINGKTTVSVPATVEYNMTSATATTWTAGQGTTLTLTPGTTYYLRVAATDTTLAGNVQTLAIPASPTAPDVSVVSIAAGDDASHTKITLANTYEYILADTLPDISASGTAGTGSATQITATGGQHVYIRVKAVANTSFVSAWKDCGGVQLGVDDITLTGVGYDVAAGTITGTTTNMQYSLDGGSIWKDCKAGNTTGLTFVAGTVKVRQKDKITNEATVTTLAAPATSNVPILGSKTSGSVTLTTMTGYEYSKDGGKTWQDSNVFSGLSGSTEYSFVGRIKATATTLPGTVSAALAVTTDSAPSGGGISSGNSSVSTPTGAPVIVDGKTVNIGMENKTGDATIVTVDQSKLGENINGAVTGSSVVVPVSENSAATASLVVKNIEDMAQKGMTLTVQTGSAAYNLNTSAIDTAALTAAFPGADMSKVPFDVTIQNSSVSVEGETLVLSPVAFNVTATYNGKTVSVDTFNAYIDRVIEVTAQQAAKITTAVVVNADGSNRHVPTNVIEKDGKYYAIINSRTNSTYALIQNEVTFADAKGKWYEGMVNEMGSRKIIAGLSASVFGGGASITRAEFAAILVRALGLPTDGTSSFSDVPTDAWYSGAVATAVQYGLATGTGKNCFNPNVAITRQEAMLMLQRAAALMEFSGARGTLDGFTDATSVGSWAEDAVKWSVGSGLIQGADGKLNPTAKITRAESAAIILRLLQKAGLVDVRS